MKIQKLYKEPNIYMTIEVKYSLGGMNYFTGKIEKRAYWIYFTLEKIEGGTHIITPMDDTNFKLLILEAKRYSKKKMESFESVVKYNRDKLFSIYEKYLNGKRIEKDEILSIFKKGK